MIDRRSYLLGYQDGREQVPSKVKETCKWKHFDNGLISGNNPECTKNPPPRHIDKFGGMKYCPYCGKIIEESK